MPEYHEPVLRHAVDALPPHVVARQAERAGWLKAAARPLSPKRLPATVTVTPGLAHRRNARLLGLVAAGFLALMAVSLLVAGGADEPVILVLSLVPPATAGGGALWHLAKARAAPARLSLTLSEAALTVDEDGHLRQQPLTAFEGVALRQTVTTKANPRARRHRTPDEIRNRWGEEIRLYWVELTHADPAQSVALWASDAPFAGSDGLGVARALADRLGLPLLSTAGIASTWDAPPKAAKRRR